MKSEKRSPEIEIVAKDLDIPWSIEFSPTGVLYFTERSGTLSKIENDQKNMLDDLHEQNRLETKRKAEVHGATLEMRDGVLRTFEIQKKNLQNFEKLRIFENFENYEFIFEL